MKAYCYPMMALLTVFLLAGGKIRAQWTSQTNPFGSGENAMVGQIQFVTASEGWISGKSNSLLHTLNGGNTWATVTPFPNDDQFSFSDPAYNLCFVNQSTGWIMKTMGTSVNDAHGAVVCFTKNGGLSWQKSIVTQNKGEIGYLLKFIDSTTGWVGVENVVDGSGKLFKTTDGGATWILTKAVIRKSDGVAMFDFVDKNTGWLLVVNDTPARFKISKTTDGGNIWVSQYVDNISNGVDTITGSGAIRFIDANTGFAVGPLGRILKTTNGGESWTKIDVGSIPNAYLKCIYMLDANKIWIGAGIPDDFGNSKSEVVIHTADGGASWSTESIGLTGAAFSIFFWDANTGWLTADKGFIGAYKNLTGVNTEAQTQPKVFAQNGKVIALNIAENCVVNIITSLGQTLKSVKSNGGQLIISDLPSGFYIVNTGKFSTKIVL